MDTILFRLINNLPHPLWADQLTLFLDYAGEFWILLSLAAVLFIVGLIIKKRKLWLGALFLAATLVTTAWVIGVLKHFFNRPRPFDVLDGVHLMSNATGGSFPSGHAAAYAALGAYMVFHFRRGHVFWACVIILGGLARIYQGVHFPGDVLEAWGVSLAIAWFMNVLCRYLERKVGESLYKAEKS